MSNYFEIAFPSFNNCHRVPATGQIVTLSKFWGEPIEILL